MVIEKRCYNNQESLIYNWDNDDNLSGERCSMMEKIDENDDMLRKIIMRYYLGEVLVGPN